MKYIIQDRKYRFFSAFDTKTGTYIRSGVLDANGKVTRTDPFQASFPHLIDVGIMGKCIHGKSGLCESTGTACYQSGPYLETPDMTVDDFRWIAEQCRGRTHQFALGGRGDPDQHEHFEALLQICRENLIVPSFTTSGYGVSSEIALLCKKSCGAVAVSWYRTSYTEKAIRLLLNAGVKTNIHYLLSRNSIDEAIERLVNNDFPEGINAIIFLLYKPVGLGLPESVIQADNQQLCAFYRALNRTHPFRVGIDSCNTPGYLNFGGAELDDNCFDTCEGARYSCYIGPDLKMTPCSFDQAGKYATQLKPKTIAEVWESASFESFRQKMKTACPECAKRVLCLGGCPLLPEIVLCKSDERTVL